MDDDDYPLIADDPFTRYYRLASDLNMLLDHGEAASAEEVEDHLHDGTLFDWIEERFRLRLLIRDRAYDRAMALGAFEALATTLAARRRFGVSRNGLCVLLAYSLEVIGSPDSWENPQDDPSFPRAV